MTLNNVLEPNQFYGMSQQAIINGNFDVWQRGTSIASSSTTAYSADRWNTFRGGFAAGLTTSRQDGTGVTGSQYCARVQRDSGNSSTAQISHTYSLETSDSIKLRDKKLTLSFFARKGSNFSEGSSTVVTSILTGTGTDQSQSTGFTGSANAAISSFVLTTSWQKFTLTTSAVIASNITEIGINFAYNPVGTAGASDYFEITQVQVNAGDQALSFKSKSINEEITSCQRYTIAYTDTNISFPIGNGFALSTTQGRIQVELPETMRISPTLTATATDWKLSDGVTATDLTTIAIETDQSSNKTITLLCTVASGLTQFRPYQLIADGTANRLMIFSAEL